MKPVTMFITDWCPHCKRALSWIDELRNENPKYASIEVKVIDEERQPEIAKKYDYYYVPTYYIDKTKIFEGGTTKDVIRRVFEKASE
ncbi:glutaredoxin family protein [Candidatus Clostridium stratigraminis]|uniref:Glutaredoxin family protein n=1 Tax=Candidatus Clostridium stratigraminis TaxID=3381661 RepID=A0ABW8T3L0_9CLOT